MCHLQCFTFKFQGQINRKVKADTFPSHTWEVDFAAPCEVLDVTVASILTPAGRKSCSRYPRCVLRALAPSSA